MLYKNLRFAVSATIAALFVASTVSGNDEEKRTLKFPAHRTVGVVFARPAKNGTTYRDSLYTADWQRVGAARGEIAVAAKADVRLDVGSEASKDLEFLDGLHADDVQVLNLGGSEAADDGLQHVGRLTGLKLLNLDRTRITDAGMRHLTPLRRLQQLDLAADYSDAHRRGIGDQALRILALAKWTELESVRLTQAQVTDDGIAALALVRSLKSVDIAGTRVTDAGLLALKDLPHLEALSLGGSSEGIDITDAGLKHVGEMSHLKDLNLSGCKATDKGLAQVARLLNLERLCLDNTDVTESGLAQLEPLSKLTNLRAYSLAGGNITDAGALALAKLKSLTTVNAHLQVTSAGLAALSELPRLKSLSVIGAGVTDEGLAHVARMRSLDNMWFQNCPITDAGLEQLSKLRNLESVMLSGTNVTGEGLRHLRQLPRLTALHLDFAAPGEGFRPMLAHLGDLKALEWLTIRSKSLSSDELKPLAELENLKSLKIGDVAVDDTAAVYIGGLMSLTHLWLEDSVLTDVGLSRLSTLPNLEFLWVSGQFTSHGLKSLERLKRLNRVQLSSPQITRDDVKALAAAAPWIQFAAWFAHSTRGPDDLSDVSVSDKDTFRREGSKEDRITLDAMEDHPPPGLTLVDWINAGDNGIAFENFMGKVVLVDFCTTRRKGGLGALPKLQELHEKFNAKGLVIFSIHASSGAETLRDFAAQQKLPWPAAADVEDATKDDWHVNSYPSYYLIDPSGKLRVARIYRGDLERAIKELLAE